jgi:hypothetical protein
MNPASTKRGNGSPYCVTLTRIAALMRLRMGAAGSDTTSKACPTARAVTTAVVSFTAATVATRTESTDQSNFGAQPEGLRLLTNVYVSPTCISLFAGVTHIAGKLQSDQSTATLSPWQAATTRTTAAKIPNKQGFIYSPNNRRFSPCKATLLSASELSARYQQ